MTIDRTGLAWEVMASFVDPASATFDAVLAAAGLDEMTARALRFWQRESVHNTRQYAASAVPAVLDAVASAQADAQAATDRGADAWMTPAQPGPTQDGVVPPTESTPPGPAPGWPDTTSEDLLEIRRSAVAARLTHLG